MRAGILALLAATSLATNSAVAADKPDLVVVISIDQFSSDLFDDYLPRLNGGIGQLAREGVTFNNAYHVQASTETCPGHATLLTGAYPSRTGIIADRWFDMDVDRVDKRISCVEDERVPGTSSATGNYRVSPEHLKMPTLSDLLALQSPASRSVAVAGKDRSAVMMTGRHVAARWYWEHGSDHFRTDQVDAAIPKAVAAANLLATKAIAEGLAPLVPPLDCSLRRHGFTLDRTGVVVGTGLQARAPGDDDAFRRSPDFDGLTFALAAGLVEEMNLGGNGQMDLLAIGISGLDQTAHSYGPGGPEACLQLHSIDNDLKGFLDFLGSRGLDVLVVLTADHGGKDIPERLRAAGDSAARRMDPAAFAERLGEQLKSELGLPHDGPLLLADTYGANGSVNDIYVVGDLQPEQRIRVRDAALAFYKAHPDVALAMTREEMAGSVGHPLPDNPLDFSLLERALASFDAERSGDLIVLPAEHVMQVANPQSTYVATHGSAWDADRRVPLIFWRKGAASQTLADPVRTVDLMPTLAAIIGVDVDPASIDGRCLTIVAGNACPGN